MAFGASAAFKVEIIADPNTNIVSGRRQACRKQGTDGMNDAFFGTRRIKRRLQPMHFPVASRPSEIPRFGDLGSD